MYEGHTVGVVVPAYNEAGLVGEVIETIPAFVDRVYVVDDRSTDGTWREIREHARRANRTASEADTAATVPDGGVAADRRVVPIRHERNRGVGGAIKTGYRHALEDGIDVTAVMAGDGQMDPDYLDRLLDPIVDGDADYTKGNRLLDTEFRREMPRFRLVGNAILTLLTRIASGYWRTGDPQNGYTAISDRALEAVDLDAAYEEYGFANELLVRLNLQDRRVVDVPVPAIYGDEVSTIRFHTFVPRVSKLLLASFLWRLKSKYVDRDPHPLVACYAVGVLGVLASGAVSALGVAPAGASSIGVAATLFAVGCLSIVAAASLDRADNDHLQTRTSPARADG